MESVFCGLGTALETLNRRAASEKPPASMTYLGIGHHVGESLSRRVLSLFAISEQIVCYLIYYHMNRSQL